MTTSCSDDNEDNWITKRKTIHTKVNRKLERTMQRLVVLEDGRVIVEDKPLVTVEDYLDEGDDADGESPERQQSASITDSTSRESGRLINHQNGKTHRTTERVVRNVKSKDTFQSTVSSVAALNLGEVSSSDVGRVITQGDKALGQLIKPYSEDSTSLVIPAKVSNKNKSHHRKIDTENIREIDKVDRHGQVRKEKWTSREVVEEQSDSNPEEGNSEATESCSEHDSGGYDECHGFRHLKQDKFVDYYRVAPGRSLADGTFLRHGLHTTSSDRKYQPMKRAVKNKSTKREALSYQSRHHNHTESLNIRPEEPEDQHRSELKSREPSNNNQYNSPYANVNYRREIVRHDKESTQPTRTYTSHYSMISPSTNSKSSMSRGSSLSNIYSSTSKSNISGLINTFKNNLYATILRKKDRPSPDTRKDYNTSPLSDIDGNPVRPPRHRKRQQLGSSGGGSVSSEGSRRYDEGHYISSDLYSFPNAQSRSSANRQRYHSGESSNGQSQRLTPSRQRSGNYFGKPQVKCRDDDEIVFRSNPSDKRRQSLMTNINQSRVDKQRINNGRT